MRKEKIAAIILAVGIGMGMFGNFEAKATENNEVKTEVEATVNSTKAEEKPEVVKLTANNSTQKVGEKLNLELLNAKAIDVNNPNTKYEIRYKTTEGDNRVSKLLGVGDIFLKAGTGEVVIEVVKDGQVIAETRQTITVAEAEQEINQAPVITGSGAVIYKNQEFDVAQLGVKATDKEDGDLTSKVKFESKVDNAKLGIYSVTATVEDSAKNKTTETFTVVVKEYKAPIIKGVPGFKLKLNVGDKFDNSMLKVTVTDQDGKDLTNKVTFEGAVDTSKVGTYKVVAKVEENKVVATQEFVVEVVKKEEVKPVEPTKPVKPAKPTKPAVKPAVKPVVKPAVKPVVKPAVKPNPEKPKTGDESTAGFLLSGIVALIGFIKMRK